MVHARTGTIRRALVAALALYALLVSGFVAGLRPAAAMGAGPGAICTHDGRQDGPAPIGTDHTLCCALACAAAAQAVPVLPPVASASRPERAATILRWGASSFAPDAIRPRLSLRARGPPFA